MKNHSNKIIIITTTILVLFLFIFSVLHPGIIKASTKAVKNKTSENEEIVLDEITVKSKKRKSGLKHDESAAGVVLTEKDMGNAGENLTDLLERQAGIKTLKLGTSNSFSTLSIRGSTSDQVIVILDGIVLNSAAGGPVDLSRLPIGNIETIEVYRGTSPLKFGSSSIGGAVSLISKSAKNEDLSLSGGYGSFSSRDARLFYSTKAGNLDTSVGFDYSGIKGNFTYTNDNGTGFDKSDDFRTTRFNNYSNQFNLISKTRYKTKSNWRFTFLEWLFYRKQGVPGFSINENSKTTFSLLESLTGLKIDGYDLFDKINFNTIISLRYINSVLDDPLSETGLGTTFTDDISYSPGIMSGSTFRINKIFIISIFGGYKYEFFKPDKNSSNIAQSSRHTLTAGIKTDIKLFKSKLIFTPSFRIENINNYRTINKTAGQGLGNSNKLKDNSNSFRLGIINKPFKDFKITLSAGQAIRMPSLFELFGNTGKVSGNPDLTSESAVNIDFGGIYLKKLSKSINLKAEAYLFYSNVKNLIQFVQTAQNISVAENVDKANIYGTELSINSNFFKLLRFTGNYTYLKAINRGNIKSRKGKSLPIRPNSNIYLELRAFKNETKNKESYLFTGIRFISKNYLDNTNLVEINERYYINSGVGYWFIKYNTALQLMMNNITNEQTLDLAGYPVPGTSFYINVKYEM